MRACVRGGPTFSDLIWALNEFVACVRCVRLLRAIVASDDRAFRIATFEMQVRNLTLHFCISLLHVFFSFVLFN